MYKGLIKLRDMVVCIRLANTSGVHLRACFVILPLEMPPAVHTVLRIC